MQQTRRLNEDTQRVAIEDALEAERALDEAHRRRDGGDWERNSLQHSTAAFSAPRLGDWLLQRKVITRKELFAALQHSYSFDCRMGDAIVTLGFLDRSTIEWQARQFLSYTAFTLALAEAGITADDAESTGQPEAVECKAIETTKRVAFWLEPGRAARE